jgi:hypothetical protein
MDVVLSYPCFYVQDRHNKQVLAQGRCEKGLYILQSDHQALISTTNCRNASFEIWHYMFLIMLFLFYKHWSFYLFRLFYLSRVFVPHQLAKAHRLPFDNNTKRALNPLDLIHCNLWGPSPVLSVENYKYYAIFIDDHS